LGQKKDAQIIVGRVFSGKIADFCSFGSEARFNWILQIG